MWIDKRRILKIALTFCVFMSKKIMKLNPKIEKILKLVESGKITGKVYTPDEYLEHVKKILKE
jgi:hypothetical protein